MKNGANMQLDHIALNVKNIETSADWYVKNFDAKIKYMDETWALLKIKNTSVALTIASQHPPHIAFRVDSLDQLPEDPVTHRDGSISCYVQDPDGNSIEYIYWPKV